MAKRVAVMMGSESDWPVMQSCVDQLAHFGLQADVQILSAHRTPDLVADFARRAADEGFGVIIAAAGMSAALPGSVAAHTTLPVIGVPMASGALAGMDALLAMSQMPPGVPVATMAIGQPGARNAAILAAEILSLSDVTLREKLQEHKRFMAENTDKNNRALRSRLMGP
jgi:phosphoribosylaminoimidazole carboxylase PurE protein